MKRFLSWLVLAALSVVFYFVEFWFWTLVFWIGDAVLRFSEALFWVLVVCEGMVALGVVVLLVLAGCRGVVAASQAVWKSKSGLRYKVAGSFLVVLNLAVFLLVITAKEGAVAHPFLSAIAYLSMIAFGLALLLSGFSVRDDYGAPPTKREVLEEKLRKLDEKEGRL